MEKLSFIKIVSVKMERKCPLKWKIRERPPDSGKTTTTGRSLREETEMQEYLEAHVGQTNKHLIHSYRTKEINAAMRDQEADKHKVSKHLLRNKRDMLATATTREVH